MKVIGIDPAPSKKTVIYNDIDGFTEIEADKLKEHLDDKFKNSEEDILICWDAPLTGGMPEKFKGGYNPFYQRKIEQLINDKVKIKGISTMGYAGCPHWAITQHCFGLPQIFQPEVPQSNLPFQLISEQKLPSASKNVVEVHPALALWLWLNEDSSITRWDYKDNKGTLKNLAEKLFTELEKQPAITIKNDKIQVTVFGKEKDINDDHLDAYIAWLLGTLWLENENKVLLVGNKNTGAMLLPNVLMLQELCKKI